MDKDLKLTIKLFSSWILLLVFFTLLGGVVFGDLNLIRITNLANWDGVHFLNIVEEGYQESNEYAFFPLYPILINIISKLLSIDYLYSAILINLISTFGVIYFFTKLLRRYEEQNIVRVLVYFLIFPTSFFLVSVYSESLFLLFTILTFLKASEKKYAWATFFAILASVTRITGVAVVLGLWAYVFMSKTKLKDRIIVLFAPLGLISYCIYLYLRTGNPFYFIISELHWDRSIAIPGLNIWISIQYLVYYGLNSFNYTIFLDLLFTIFGLGMGLRVIKYLKMPFSTFTVSGLFIPLMTPILLSIPRFLLVIFPIFIVLGRIKNRVFQLSYIIISVTFLFIFFNFFLRNLWVS